MTYVKRSLCSGNLPQQFNNLVFFDRRGPLALMMRNREMVRYLCAPTGFGKSLLTCSYANMVNGFQATMWLDAENPCFLRDLDAHTLLPDIMDVTSVGDLVVFDDVPHLGAARRAQVWKTCSTLVTAGREVVLCATPTADPLRGHEQSCIRVGATDLLYNEKDRDDLRIQGISLRQDVPALHPVAKVPALANVVRDSFLSFLRSHIDDMDDPAQSALSFVLLMLERGTFEDLEMMLGTEITAADIDAENLRAFIQVDEYRGEFAALGFPLPEVLSAFAPYMAGIARETGADDASELALQLADVLLEKKCAERAAQLLLRVCDPHRRSMWLAQRQEDLLNMCALAPAEMIFDSIRSERWRSKPELQTASCVHRALLDYAEGALEELTRTASKVEFPLSERLRAASVAYVLTEEAQQAKDLEQLFHAQGQSLKREATQLTGAAKQQWVFWSKAASGISKIDNLAGRLDEEENICLALACCIHKARLDGVDPAELPRMLKLVVRLMEAEKLPAPPNAALVLLRREVDSIGFELDMTHMPFIAAYHRCDIFEDELEVQRTAYARSRAAKASALASAMHAESIMARHNAQRQKDDIPVLKVRLFGGFDVSLGDTRIDPAEFKRQKVRTLLALLALEGGHEFSCDNLAERLWPESSDVRARHNLYNCLSILRRGISLADGSCPYLHRPHGVVSLKQANLQSDVLVMKDLCSRLRFSDPDPNLYFHILEQIRELYRGDLLPGETDEPMVIAAREEWRNRVVGTLLHAAGRLAAVGDSTVALLLAEQALTYNPQREDCYEQLMSLQARCGQRPAALRTWKRYRSYMVDELGLDPSQRISDLYQRILNETL